MIQIKIKFYSIETFIKKLGLNWKRWSVVVEDGKKKAKCVGSGNVRKWKKLNVKEESSLVNPINSLN